MAGQARSTLGAGRVIGFTVGDFAFNLYWQSISLYLLFFYTDAVGLSAGAAGLIYMIASIFDAAIDPLMGAIADRTRTRWGRYRPYVLFGGPFVAVTFVLLYFKPDLAGSALAAWMLGAHILFRVAYTFVSIPYTAMSARITRNSGERGSIAGGRIIFATLAGLTVAVTTQPLAAQFAGGSTTRGYLIVAAIFAAIATIIFPIVVAATREPEDEVADIVPHSLAEYWQALKGNRALWIMLAAICAGQMCSTSLGKSLLYYFKYYLHDEAQARTALSLSAASGLIIVPIWMVVTRWIGKRNAFLTAVVWGLAGLAWFAVTDVRSSGLMIGFFLWMQVTGLGLALGFWSILPDTVEYGEWRSGRRTESFVFGLGQFFLKVALGLGAGLFGWLLGLIGYHANVAQSAETLGRMKVLMTALPAIGLVIAGGAMLFYPLRGKRHDEIVAELEARRNTVVAEH